MAQFTHHNIDLSELNNRIADHLAYWEPLMHTELEVLIDTVLQSIPDAENRIIVTDPVTDEPIGRYVLIPLHR